MNQLTVNAHDELVMKLLNYFITEKNYSPIVIRGIQDEIWLENLQEDYKIIRIVSNYIHNNEQLEVDINKSTRLMRTIKKKTFSFKMKAINIFINVGNNVDTLRYDNPQNVIAKIEDADDLNKYNLIVNNFPDITKKMTFSEKGIELFMKITKDINQKNEGEARMTEDVFTMKKPIITYALIAINIIVFVLTNYTGNTLAFADNRYWVVSGEYYRMFTSMFLHANEIHLLINCYALYIIGMQIESFLGKAKYITVYILSGIAGSTLSLLFNTGYSVGASGAIFGLLGALVYFGYHYRVYLDTVVRSQIIPIIILNLFIGMTISDIDNWAHIGGLVGGVMATMAVGIKYKSTTFNKVNGVILYLIYVVALLYLVFNPSILGI